VAREAIQRAKVALVQQASGAAPGWGVRSGDEVDLATTSLVLLHVDLEGSKVGAKARERTLDWIERQLSDLRVDGASKAPLADSALAANAVLHHRPGSPTASVARALLVARAIEDGDVWPVALTALGAREPRTPALNELLERTIAVRLGTGPTDADDALDLLEIALLGGRPDLSLPAVKDACRLVRDTFDPLTKLFGGPGHQDVARSARAIAVLARGCSSGEDADLLGDAVDALCSLDLKGGGWGTRNATTYLDDIVDNAETALAVAALTACLQVWYPPLMTRSARGPRLVDDLYRLRHVVRMDDFPVSAPDEHTMYAAVDPYSEQKLPADEMTALKASGGRIEIHGVYPSHLPALLDRQFSNIELMVEQTENLRRMATTKRFNTVRPHFFRAEDVDGFPVMLVAVGCGDDYVMHYAAMVRHVWIAATRVDPEDHLAVYRYPTAERTIAYWTQLDETFVQRGDRVVIGYVDECRDRLGGPAATVQSHESEFYGADVIHDGEGGRVVFLGVKFSFWGSISYHLAARLCSLGASEVLYVGKLGALSAPDDLYEKVFVPSSFVKLRHNLVEYVVDPVPPNGVLQWREDLDSGVHVSIPTVLEEDYHQRHQVELRQAQSIDNEISQIAQAISEFNTASQDPVVQFSAVHFATDYIREEKDRRLATAHDLSRTRTPAAKQGRSQMLDRITQSVLAPYLGLADR